MRHRRPRAPGPSSRGEGQADQPATGRGELEVLGRSPSGELAPAGERVVSTGLADRLEERRRAVRSLRRRRLMTTLAVVAVVAVLVWIPLFSPLFSLHADDIHVSGADSTVSVQDVRQALAPQVGQSLVSLNLEEMGHEVTDALVRVRSVRVTRNWPRGVDVALTLRVPVAVRQVEGGYELLDGDAVVLGTVGEAPAGLATIVTPQGESLTGEQVSAVAVAIGALDPAVRAQVVSGTASATGQVSLSLTSGSTVVWGDTTDLALKARVLTQLLGARSASVYDVSAPRSPVTAGEATPTPTAP